MCSSDGLATREWRLSFVLELVNRGFGSWDTSPTWYLMGPGPTHSVTAEI